MRCDSTFSSLCTACLLLISCWGCGQTPGEPAAVSQTPASSGPQPRGDEPSELPPAESREVAASPSEAEAAFAKLRSATEDGNPEAWSDAEQQLIGLGDSAVSTLAGHLSDPDQLSRELAVQFLAQLGPAAQPAANELANALKDDSPIVRVNAAATLLLIEPESTSARDVLSELLAGGDDHVRLTAAISLAGSEASAEDSIKTLTALLAAAEPTIRLTAVETLGRLGKQAESSLPAIERLVDDDNPEIRAAATTAQRRIETGETEPSETVPTSGTAP